MRGGMGVGVVAAFFGLSELKVWDGLRAPCDLERDGADKLALEFRD